MIEGLFFILNRLEVGDPSVTQHDVDLLKARIEARQGGMHGMDIETYYAVMNRIDELWEKLND